MRVCKSSLSAEKPQNPGLTWINGCRSESTSAPTSVVIYCQTNGEAVAALVGQLGQGGQLAPHVGHPIVIAEPQRHALWERSARRWSVGSALSPFGSALLGLACRGCMCASTIGPTTMAMRHIGTPPERAGAFVAPGRWTLPVLFMRPALL